MDVSESMVEEIEQAKEGLRLYVRLFRPIDRGGIVQFSSKVIDYQPMTNDTSILIEKINNATVGGGTAIYDALMTAIDGIKCDLGERGRRSIIVYTDGEDKSSYISPQAVIDSARVYNLPIYTIALGNMTQEDVLKLIAEQTNGIFFKAATAEEMKIIYGKLSELMQNYYVMAHASPDPNYNNTWRLVDLTVSVPGQQGRGLGRYFVGGPPEFLETDLEVNLISKTDTFMVIAGDTINAVMPGNTFEYLISLKNLGPNPADTVKLVQLLPDSISFISSMIPPQFLQQDSLVWYFLNFQPGSEENIRVVIQLADKVPEELSELISKVNLFSSRDTILTNNFGVDTVRVLFKLPQPKKNFDLSLSQVAITDTTIELAGKTFPAVLLGNSYGYSLVIKNFGPATAYDLMLWDVFPDSVSLSGFNIMPSAQDADTLFWQFDSLSIGDSIHITFNGTVKDSLPFYPFPLINSSGLIAENDTLNENNFAATTVYAIARSEEPQPMNADIVVRQFSVTDSFAVIRNDTLKFARQGETYSYNITVTNESSVAAQNVTIVNNLPDSITVSNYQPIPEMITEDLLIWEIGVLLPQSSFKFSFDATVSPTMPIGRNLLINTATGSATNEDPTRLNNNVSVDTVFNLVKPTEGWEPQIEAMPSLVEVGNTISVRVQVLAPIDSWDLWIYFADNQIDSTYADEFIATHELAPNLWYDIEPKFIVIRMVTRAEQEPITFELRTRDVYGDLKTAQASVTIISFNDFNIDRNVFIPDQEDALKINVKLSSDQVVRLELHDITGTKITKITESQFNAGWNTYQWNGLTDKGQKIGSGFYIITIYSSRYHAWKKLMIIR